MSDKLSIREFIDTELNELWKEYMPDVDSKISCSKSRYENDISTSGYVKENDELGNFTYYILVDNEEYLIVKPYNGSPLFIAIENIKNNYTEEIDITAIDNSLLTSSEWTDCGTRVFSFDNVENTWYGKYREF